MKESKTKNSETRNPHISEFQIGAIPLRAEHVIEALAPFVTLERWAKMQNVVKGRTFSVTPVLDGIYDQGNVNAVMRTAEGLGYQSLHVLRRDASFRVANRVSQGSDKWLDVFKWNDPKACIQDLRSKGYRILATHLDENAKPWDAFDWSVPTAVVLGNEGAGVSGELLDEADATCMIPMSGFVQSFNISVAGAILMHGIRQSRVELMGRHGDLNSEEQEALLAHYLLKSVTHAEQILERTYA